MSPKAYTQGPTDDEGTRLRRESEETERRERELRQQQDPMDWLRNNCSHRTDTGRWLWQSGCSINEAQSVAIVTRCWARGMEPSDMISGQFLWDLVERVVTLEGRVSELLAQDGSAPA